MADRTSIGRYKVVKWVVPYTVAAAQDYSPVLCPRLVSIGGRGTAFLFE